MSPGCCLQCTVGYGEVRAVNTAEQAFLCVVLVITALTYSIIFGNVAVQIQELDRVRADSLYLYLE